MTEEANNAQTAGADAAQDTVKSTPAKPLTKSATVIKLLSRSRGATLKEMSETTGWQPHSTRAFLTGLRKKGRTLGKEPRKSGETAYRLGATPVPTDSSQ